MADMDFLQEIINTKPIKLGIGGYGEVFYVETRDKKYCYKKINIGNGSERCQREVYINTHIYFRLKF